MQSYSDVFTEDTWRAFVAAGGRVTAFSASQRAAAFTVEPGDQLLCYLRRKFVWVGALRAVSKAYESSEAIWGLPGFPLRVNVEPVWLLQPTNGVAIDELAGQLSFYPAKGAPNWGSHLQGSPRRMLASDARVTWSAVESRARLGLGKIETASERVPEQLSSHSQVQAKLVEFGLATGCQVWVPKADRPKIAAYSEVRRLLLHLPLAFGGMVDQTVGNIDVLWFRGPTVVAAFEIEHSTSIYSGLLRMSDLMTVFPNVPFPLYVVAPERRLPFVRTEITRPTFARLNPPLATKCKFISYEALERLLNSQSSDALKYLDPAIIDTIADSFAELGS